MTEALTPSEHAVAIAAALERMLAFVAACSDDDWHARPLRGHGDARPVSVIADHVADAYDYMGAWVREIAADGEPEVTVAQIDRLNAEHARQAELVTQAEAAGHLRRSGAEFVEIIRSLAPSDLERQNGRVRRFAEIAARHPDNHRSEIQAALGQGH
jgi:hypothetical protein